MFTLASFDEVLNLERSRDIEGFLVEIMHVYMARLQMGMLKFAIQTISAMLYHDKL